MLPLNPLSPSHRMTIFWNKKDQLVQLISSSRLDLNNIILWDSIGQVVTQIPETIYDLFSVEIDKSRTGSLGGIIPGQDHKVIYNSISLFDKTIFPLLLTFDLHEIQLFHDLCPHFHSKVHRYEFIHDIIDVYLSKERASHSRNQCIEMLNTIKGSYAIGELTKIYLQFQMGESEFINLYHMYHKQDVLGKIFLDRATKEIGRAAKRNGYANLFCELFSEIYLSDMQHEAIFSFILLRSKEITPLANQNGRHFEEKCDDLLRKAGFATSITATTGDFGGDIVAEYRDIRYVIQCKGGLSRVGIKAVQEAIAAKGYYKCDAAVVIADAEFTNAAIELARSANVSLLRTDQIPSFTRMIL